MQALMAFHNQIFWGLIYPMQDTQAGEPPECLAQKGKDRQGPGTDPSAGAAAEAHL